MLAAGGKWKLIEDLEDGSLRLYNLVDDVGEQKDMAKAQPERTQAMRAQLHAWKKAVSAREMVVNPKFDQAKFDQNQVHQHTKRKQQLETFHRNLVHPPNPVKPDEPVTYRSSAFRTKK